MNYGALVIDLPDTKLDEESKALLTHPNLGGILLFSRNYESLKQIQSLVAAIRLIRSDLVFMVDHEGGLIWRFNKGFKVTPSLFKIGALYNFAPAKALAMAQLAGQQIAIDLAAVDIDLSMGPCLDLHTGVSRVMRDRCFHHQPEVVVKLARAMIQGMNAIGMSAVGKHFPGHGTAEADSHFEQVVDNRSFSAIEKHDLMPFAQLASQLQGVMPAHIVFPQVDAKPTGFSTTWLQAILRQQLKFKGAIISDCLSMLGAGDEHQHEILAQQAVDAGCDLVILSRQSRQKLRQILDNLKVPNDARRQARIAGLRLQAEQPELQLKAVEEMF